MDKTPTAADLFEIRDDQQPSATTSRGGGGRSSASRRPGQSLLWAAPGSLSTDQVADAFEAGGVPALARVAGPWAVVLRDQPTGDVVVACDPVGVQPLFWACTRGGSIVVSSWLASLAQRDDVDDALDYDGVVMSEAHGCHGPESLAYTRFKAIRKVPWGRALRIRPDRTLTTTQYWFPEDLPGPDTSLSLDDCAALLRERIDTAVRRLTATDVPVASHVSGGLDCSAIACRADEVLREGGYAGLVAGYSWSPSVEHVPRFEGDERSILDAISAARGFPIRLLHPDESGDWWILRDPNVYPQSTHVRERWTLPQAAADGVRVLLSGWGGDELASFNGRQVLPMLIRQGRFPTVWRESVRRAQVQLPGRIGPTGKTRTFAGALLSAMPERIQDLRHREEAKERAQHEREIDAALRDFSPIAADVRQTWNRNYRVARTPRDVQMVLLTGGHIQHRTAAWYQTGRLWGIDYRYPLLDLGVVETALQLPWWAWRSGGWSRVAYRKAVADWVPDSVAWNTSKVEPASFFPPERRPVERKAPPRRPVPISDDKYRAAMQVIARSYRRGARQLSPDSRVRAAPDAAPQ